MHKIVYHLVDPRTGLPFYVGMGGRKRVYDHTREVKNGKCTNREKAKIIVELFTLNLVPAINVIAENLSTEDAKLLEIEEIAKYGRLDLETGILTNMTNGGDIPPEFNSAIIRKLSQTSKKWHRENKLTHKAACKKHANTQANKKRISTWAKNQIRTDDRKLKHKIASLESQNRPETKLKKSIALTGKTRTDEQKNNIRAGQLKESVRLKNSQSKTGSKNPRAKSCYYKGKFYACVKDACDEYRISRYSVQRDSSFRYT